jgi:hypothetical protein
MTAVTPFWERQGIGVSYPGLVQTDNTCVFVSIASAINWLSQATVTEIEILEWFRQAGHRDVNFATVLDVVRPRFQATRFDEYIDPLPNVDALIDRVRSGGVLVLSLELATPECTYAVRSGQWHMISVFRSGGDDAQVWDTNGFSGFLKWSEVKDVLVGDELAIRYPPLGCLVPHSQHHCLSITRR